MATYKPSIDVAFKKRLYDKVGTTIGDSMIANVLSKVGDSYLTNGDQRVCYLSALKVKVCKHFQAQHLDCEYRWGCKQDCRA